MVSILVLQQYV